MHVAKIKVLTSFAELICVFFFANAKCWFSHDVGHGYFIFVKLVLALMLLCVTRCMMWRLYMAYVNC